jgi:cysteine desulfurase/selenocysteine lyase
MRPSLASKDEFPASSDVVYLNQASVGLVPERARNVLRTFQDRLVRNGTIYFSDEDEEASLDGLRRVAGRLLNAPPSSIAVLSSTTEAINQFAWWLNPGPGSNVVLIDADFPSVVLPWIRLAEETGLQLRLLPVREAPERLTTGALTALIDADTAAICVSHVQFATGHRLDLEEIGRAAGDANAYLVVDATQSAGIVPIDLAAAPVDLLVASSHKWLCAPHGVAICHLGSQLDRVFRPPFVGWRGASDPMGFRADTSERPTDARRIELGALAYSAAAALGEAIDYLSELDMTRVYEHGLWLAGRLLDGLSDLGATVWTPRDPEWRAAIVTAHFDTLDATRIARALKQKGVHVSVRLGGLRLSTHVFNDEQDVARALDELALKLT